MAATETDVWAGRELAAIRGKKQLTQEQVAELTGLDRATIVKLESGDRKISPYYAEKLAPHLGVKDPRILLPPQEQPAGPTNPLSRLAALEDEVERLRAERDFALREVVARLAALEVAPAQQERPEGQQSSTTPE